MKDCWKKLGCSLGTVRFCPFPGDCYCWWCQKVILTIANKLELVFSTAIALSLASAVLNVDHHCSKTKRFGRKRSPHLGSSVRKEWNAFPKMWDRSDKMAQSECQLRWGCHGSGRPQHSLFVVNCFLRWIVWAQCHTSPSRMKIYLPPPWEGHEGATGWRWLYFYACHRLSWQKSSLNCWWGPRWQGSISWFPLGALIVLSESMQLWSLIWRPWYYFSVCSVLGVVELKFLVAKNCCDLQISLSELLKTSQQGENIWRRRMLTVIACKRIQQVRLGAVQLWKGQLWLPESVGDVNATWSAVAPANGCSWVL